MALVIEDGTQIENANSYATDAEFSAYAAARNFTIPALEADRDVLMIKAMDYLADMESEMKGVRVSSSQAVSYPRSDVLTYGFIVNSDAIPQSLKNAQMEAAIAAYTQELLSNAVVNNVQSEAVDVISTSYFDGGNDSRIKLDRVIAQLKHLLIDNNQLLRV
jgi:ABC-type hemin transport system ATPase subunit